jgi:hypothetical protein
VRVARLVGPQYYWINHGDPVALLGYIAVLEGNAPDPGLADLLAERTGLPRRAFRTLRHHAEVDGDHCGALFDLLTVVDLRPEQHSIIRASALHTAAALIDLFDSLAGPGGIEEKP